MLIIIFSCKETVHILLMRAGEAPLPSSSSHPTRPVASVGRLPGGEWQEELFSYVTSSSGYHISSVGGYGHLPTTVRHMLSRYAGSLQGNLIMIDIKEHLTSLRHQWKTGIFYSHWKAISKY